jgi:hypothetical protein
VITHSPGNCGSPARGRATKAATPDTSPASRPAEPRAHLYQAKAADHPDYRSMFREASW